MLWHKKYRHQWIVRNTKFYHTKMVVRRRRNQVTMLPKDGMWMKDPKDMQETIVNFFKVLYYDGDKIRS